MGTQGHQRLTSTNVLGSPMIISLHVVILNSLRGIFFIALEFDPPLLNTYSYTVGLGRMRIVPSVCRTCVPSSYV